ncbi:glycosyltransferase [uncultured Mitsuokella sp.]|uniref:glycosyltransferase n=1 Tax=uncultured Mitsuokella sp. TaxID=453120 RepID=UPI00266FD465|nr:glycosyltransferase [uncultured Mitsuokella sp.]
MNEKLVTIAMALYKPNLLWLKKQLESLNKQDYPNLELVVWNDCPEKSIPVDLFHDYITRFPYKLFQGKSNLGSTKVFEKITELADGKYIAYCDQDDIWHANKISTLVRMLEQHQGSLACCDMRVIDQNGVLKADKITDVRPRQQFVTGNHQLESLLTKNFVTGCAMLCETKMAQQALPFPKELVHDHWLSVWNAVYGKIVIAEESLIDYRIHGDNQTGILAGVVTKRDYFTKKCLLYYERISIINNRLNRSPAVKLLREKMIWAQRRVNYLKHPGLGTFLSLLACCRNDILVTGFELFLPIIPKKIFKMLIKSLQCGRI